MGIVSIRPDLCRALHRVARWWVLLSLVGFAVVAWGVGLPGRPQGELLSSRVESLALLCLLGLAALAWLISARWPGMAAIVLTVAAAGFTGLAALAFDPAVAPVMAVL